MAIKKPQPAKPVAKPAAKKPAAKSADKPRVTSAAPQPTVNAGNIGSYYPHQAVANFVVDHVAKHGVMPSQAAQDSFAQKQMDTLKVLVNAKSKRPSAKSKPAAATPKAASKPAPKKPAPAAAKPAKKIKTISV